MLVGLSAFTTARAMLDTLILSLGLSAFILGCVHLGLYFIQKRKISG